MGCFAVQKAKKKSEEQLSWSPEANVTRAEDIPSSATSSSPSSLKEVAFERPSFRKTAKAIQNAQRFINHSNPSRIHSNVSREVLSPEQGTALNDTGTPSKPMPLPSPKRSPELTGYALPQPLDHSNSMATSPNLLFKNASTTHATLNNRVFPWDLQPLPPPKESFVVSKELRNFTFVELATACQNFSHQALIGDDGFCFHGAISRTGKRAKKHQHPQEEVVILRLHEKLHLGLKERLMELYSTSLQLSSHVCKIVGFSGEDCIQEQYLVYEKLAKGSLHSLLFEASDTPTLDWSTRLKLIYGSVAGLASLQERFPDQVLYRDFRLSLIQVDGKANAKITGYWFVTSCGKTVLDHVLSNLASSRDNAYCAPETRSKGVITWKSNVWSLGVVMLEVLSGRKNRDERMVKDEEYDIVQWARPFLREEDKLFLIMDPKLQGQFHSKGAKIMANLILQCLNKDPTRRPSLKVALEMMTAVKDPRQTNMTGRNGPSMNQSTITMSAPLSASSPHAVLDRKIGSYTRSPSKFDLIQSPLLKPLVIPARYAAD